MHALARHILVGLGAGGLAWLATALPPASILSLKLHDLFLSSSCPHRAPGDVVIVAIDEPSFTELGLQWPWPRRLHARLIDTLTEQGAAGIGFDIVFAEPSDPDDDRAFASAIERAGNVVLAAAREPLENNRFAGEMLVEPLPLFARHARTGLAALPLDRDFIVRRLPETAEEMPPLAGAVLARAHPRGPPQGAGIAFCGPAGTFDTVSYYQVLEAARLLPARFFAGKTVLVGRVVTASPEPGHLQPDVFATPFLFGGGGPLMSGVELHANVFAGLREGRWISPAPVWVTLLVSLLAGLAGSAANVSWHPWRSGVLTLGLGLAIVAASWIVFAHPGWWISPLAAVLGSTAPYAGFALHAYLVSERRRRELRRAFSHYLAPSILAEVLRDPGALRLGGRKAEVTLLFTDLEGFTGISQTLAPEQVGRFLNRYFTEMTRIVFAHRGTVDKFIGDALVAFWGAPLADPQHARQACRAALAMQARMERLREEMRAEGLPELRMRIGLNTGEAVVGNMGSSELFNYTALGDAVNLASRLEGANKQFGTSILVSEAVVRAAGAGLVTRALGELQVRGRSAPVVVHELLSATPAESADPLHP